MSTAKINSGVCGFETTVSAESDSAYQCKLKIESTCPHVTKMAETMAQEIDTFNVMNELFKKGESQVQTSAKVLPHLTCPVTVGILKAMEVSAGLALAKDVEIKIEK